LGERTCTRSSIAGLKEGCPLGACGAYKACELAFKPRKREPIEPVEPVKSIELVEPVKPVK
jgi:hypothetical protein